MAVLDSHEQEQIDALKSWWKENGRKFILLLVLAAAVVGAVAGWKFLQGKHQAEASAMLDGVIQQIQGNDPKRVDDAAAALADKYGSTIFAARAQLISAQVYLNAGNSAAAQGKLQWVMDHASDEGLRIAARLKLASALLDDKKYDDALRLLEVEHPESYAALFSSLKGDIYWAQGKKDEARVAYQQALATSVSRGNFAALVQNKLNALGGNAPGPGKSEADKPGAAK